MVDTGDNWLQVNIRVDSECEVYFPYASIIEFISY
jgi:hypothetical protein